MERTVPGSDGAPDVRVLIYSASFDIPYERLAMPLPPSSGNAELTAAERQVARYKPANIHAPNHNDLRAFVHAWFAAFDHAEPAEFFIRHLDDADMTFDFDGRPLATDHASFRTWYADALDHFPWDFHDVLDFAVSGTAATGWAAEFFFRHVGEWRDDPDSDAVRPFNRVLHCHWRVEHDGARFLIRRYDLTIAQNIIPL